MTRKYASSLEKDLREEIRLILSNKTIKKFFEWLKKQEKQD